MKESSSATDGLAFAAEPVNGVETLRIRVLVWKAGARALATVAAGAAPAIFGAPSG